MLALALDVLRAWQACSFGHPALQPAHSPNALMPSPVCCNARRLVVHEHSAPALGALRLSWRLCFPVLLCTRLLISVPATPLLTLPPTCTAALPCLHGKALIISLGCGLSPLRHSSGLVRQKLCQRDQSVLCNAVSHLRPAAGAPAERRASQCRPSDLLAPLCAVGHTAQPPARDEIMLCDRAGKTTKPLCGPHAR